MTRKEYIKKMSEDQRGPLNRFWRGGRSVSNEGYIRIYSPDHPQADSYGYVVEHRLVMERNLGRFLLPTEVVHHINGIAGDNRIENLELFSGSGGHINMHNVAFGEQLRDPITGRWLPRAKTGAWI
jgi:hypothetical protein